MGKLKWLWIACAIATFACVTLSLVSLVLIANMAERAEEAADRTEDFLEEVDARINSIERSIHIVSSNVSAGFEHLTSTPPDVEADVLFDSITLREKNGKIAVFSADGVCLHTLDVDVSTLPKADQIALSSGITVHSWRELIALIEDFE